MIDSQHKVLFYRKKKQTMQKNIYFGLHALRQNDIRKESRKKEIIPRPAPPSDLNTFLLHGASLFFSASLASL